MRPKKREREKKAPQEPLYETPQADHELFLQAFESKYKHMAEARAPRRVDSNNPT